MYICIMYVCMYCVCMCVCVNMQSIVKCSFDAVNDKSNLTLVVHIHSKELRIVVIFTSPSLYDNLQLYSIQLIQTDTTGMLNAMGTAVPPPPPLTGNVDPSKIDEIRRTIYVGNLNTSVSVRESLRMQPRV